MNLLLMRCARHYCPSFPVHLLPKPHPHHTPPLRAHGGVPAYSHPLIRTHTVPHGTRQRLCRTIRLRPHYTRS